MKYIEFDESRPMDLVLLGRVAIDFNPAYNDQVKEEFKPLKKVHMFEKFVGGSPANIAVGVTKHGLKAGFIGKVKRDRVPGEKLETDQIKLQLLQQDYKAFSKAAGLRTQNERLEKVGFAWKESTESRKVAESHYREWSKSIGADNSIKTLAEYYDVLQRYARDVDSGWISPLSRFDNYEALYNQIQAEIVGTTASNGVVITGQSQHFMQRVIGTMVDPQKLRDNLQIIRRSGVDINSIKDTLYNPVEVCPIRVSQSGQKSVKLNGKNCSVTINPDTGILIQTNPRKEE